MCLCSRSLNLSKALAEKYLFFHSNFEIYLLKKKTYLCNECTMKFEDFYAYCSHLIKEHQDSIKANLRCPICKNIFHRGSPYQNHIRTHLKICQIEVKRLNINNRPRSLTMKKAYENAKTKLEGVENTVNVINSIIEASSTKTMPKKVVKVTQNKISNSDNHFNEPVIAKMKQASSLNIKEIQNVLNKFSPSHNNVRKLLSDEVIVIDE